MRKLISLVLSVMMLLTLLPVTALAEDGERTESDEGVSLTVEGQTVRFYTGMAGGYLEYNADGLAEAGTIDEGNIPAFFVRNADFTGNIFLAVEIKDGSAPAVAVWGDCGWITVTEEHPNDVTAAQFAVYKAEISESRGDNNTAYLTLGNSTFAIVFENSGDGGSGGTFDISKLEGAALTYAQMYLVESNGHLKRSDEDATGIELGQDSYSDDEIGTIKTAIHAFRKLDYTVRDPLMWLRLPNDDMELGEYLTRLAVVAGISLWSDDADIGEDAALLRSVNGHDIRFCSCVDYGVPSLEHWSGSYVSEDESDAAFHTSWDMKHFVLIFNCTADNPLTGLTVKDAEGTESENQYTVTDEEDTLTVSIEDYGSDEFDGEVRHNFGIEKTELPRAHTLTFVATYKNGTSAEFSVVFEERNSGSDWGSNILTAGTIPTAPSDYLKVLYDAGYTFPTIGADFHLTFPPELKEWTEDCGDDWDYRVEINADTGRIDVIMNYGDPARWEAAARSALNDSFMADGIFYRYYFGDFDGERPLTYGMDGFRQTSSTEAIENWLEMGLYDSYYPNNGRHMATLNRQDASSTMMIIDKADAWEVIAIAMDEADGKTAANASVRYALELHVTATATVREKLAAVGGTVIQNASRIIVNPDATWTSEFTADGTLFMRSPNFDYENRYGEKVGELTVTAPAGYTLQEWTTFGSSYGDRDTQFPVRLRNLFDQRIDLTWVNETTGERLQEQVLVEYGYDKAWMDLLASDLTDTSAVYKPATIMDGETKAKLEANGISVTYYPDTGYFVTSVDATKVKDISVLEEGVELPVPDNLQETAKYCKIGGFGGSENPNTHGQLRAEAVRESFRYELEAESIEDGVAKLPFINLACIDVAGTGLQVYYAKSQMYDSCVVQWLAEDDTVLGYSYVYGRNGDFVTAVQTNVVSAVTEAVEAPTLVNGESDVTFTCDRLPQSGGGDSKSVYLQLDVEGASGEQVVYLPYSYLDMTAEGGLALAKQGEHPTIYHYLDDGCTDYEKITGEYTEYGVKFTTTGFSPFVLDCSRWGDLNGSGRMEITDMQALYEHLTGIKELARTGACDLNNDGEVDVYDLQSLYERVSRQSEEGMASAGTG